MLVAVSGSALQLAPHFHATSNASTVRGFNLRCQTRISAHDDHGRLRLLRYVLRPAIAQDRLRFDGSVVTFEMKRTFSDGTRLLKLTPQRFIRRIALLIPAPRHHEVTYLGLLAANAKHRADIVRVSTHRRRARPAGDAPLSAPPRDPTPGAEPLSTMRWSELLRRTFAVDVLRCERCGGRARVVAAITERRTIDKILACVHAATGGNPASARGPPSHHAAALA